MSEQILVLLRSLKIILANTVMFCQLMLCILALIMTQGPVNLYDVITCYKAISHLGSNSNSNFSVKNNQ